MSCRILVGDVRDRLAELPDRSVQMVCTSPPYYGLRDYGVAGQIGLEPTLAEYITTLVDVFRDVRRVLRDDGTLWLNVGDSYASTAPGTRNGSGTGLQAKAEQIAFRPDYRVGPERIKAKDLMMVPARLAIALCEDGWYLRSDIIWAKPNPMPESVTDRPTSAHEHIFLLSKERRYFYGADAVRVELATPIEMRGKAGWGRATKDHHEASQSTIRDGNGRMGENPNGANLRNVWHIATKGYTGAHFATFPPEIPERCIKAGSREGDTILDPFGGAGTTGLVAERLGRDSILIELNPAYAEMAERRLADAPKPATVADLPLFADLEAVS